MTQIQKNTQGNAFSWAKNGSRAYTVPLIMACADGTPTNTLSETCYLAPRGRNARDFYTMNIMADRHIFYGRDFSTRRYRFISGILFKVCMSKHVGPLSK